jgi:hypothetical protein
MGSTVLYHVGATIANIHIWYKIVFIVAVIF